MYVAEHFSLPSDQARQLLSHVGAADLVTVHEAGPVATYVPFVFDPDIGGHGALLTHVARNNSQAREATIGEALVIAHGADHYISPGWQTSQAETGTVVVEAALTLLLFFTVLFAIMEGGRFLNVQQTLTNAAREGARLAVAPLSQTSTLASNGQIEAEIQVFLDAARISGATVTVERPVIVQANGVTMQYTRVRVSVPYQVISLAAFSALSVNLAGEALMRNETSP